MVTTSVDVFKVALQDEREFKKRFIIQLALQKSMVKKQVYPV